MTLADLLTPLETCGALPASRAKDCKTSLRYLAAALGHASPEQCPMGVACRDPATWANALEAHFATLEAQGRTISAVTRRNTRNNLRVVFRLAEAHGLLTAPLPSRLLAKTRRYVFLRQQRETAPYQTSYRAQGTPQGFGLPQAAWPPDIVQGFRDWQAKEGFRLRAATLRGYVDRMAIYLGYLTNICGRVPAWDTLFDLEQLAEYLRWQEQRLQRPATAGGLRIVMMLAAMAKVLGHPASRALADFRNALPTPDPLHTKRAHWVSLATLEAVAEACLTEGRVPVARDRRDRQHPGVRRATRFQVGVILKLLVRIPLRQRNVRELRLEHNLYRDAAGHWQLHFRGSELKIGRRGNQPNTYYVDLTDYCPDFLPVLEEFLTVHRLRLPQAATSPFCFLTCRGNPYTSASLRKELWCAVALRTGQRFYPHLIRTIWATEYLEKTQNFTTAAVLLGDTVGTVMKTYYDVINKNHHANAKAFLASALHTG